MKEQDYGFVDRLPKAKDVRPWAVEGDGYCWPKNDG